MDRQEIVMLEVCRIRRVLVSVSIVICTVNGVSEFLGTSNCRPIVILLIHFTQVPLKEIGLISEYDR